MAIQNTVDLLIALVYAPGATGLEGEPIRGFTRLQKLLFLLWKEASFDEYVPELRQFVAYNYGPFSSNVYDDIEFAESIGLIGVKKARPELKLENTDEIESYEGSLDLSGIEIDDLKTREDFELTEGRGMEIAREIWHELDEDQRRRLQKVKASYNQMPFMRLIRYVYSEYPDYAKKSILLI